MHSPMCGHATGEPAEYAEVAQSRGLKGIVITDHFPLPEDWQRPRMTEAQLPAYIALVERAREEWHDRLDIRLGLECEYAPGLENWIEKQLARGDFELVLGSVHALPKYVKMYWQGDVLALQKRTFEHLAAAAESGYFQALAHLDHIRLLAGEEWDLSRILDDVLRCLDRVAATGVAVEVNTAGLRSRFLELYPSRTLLHAMKERDIPVVVGSDAHRPEHVAHEFEHALDVLAEVGYAAVTIPFAGGSCEVPIPAARASLGSESLSDGDGSGPS